MSQPTNQTPGSNPQQKDLSKPEGQQGQMNEKKPEAQTERKAV